MRAVPVCCYLCIRKDTFLLKPYSWVPETVVTLFLTERYIRESWALGFWMKLPTVNGSLCGSLPLAWAEDSGGLSLPDRMGSKSTPSVYSAWAAVLHGRHGFLLREGEQLTTLHLFRARLTFTAKWKPSLFFHLTIHQFLHWHSCAGLNTIWSNTVL